MTELSQGTDDALSVFRTFAADEELAKLSMRIERRNGQIWDGMNVDAEIPRWTIHVPLGEDGTEDVNRIQRLAKTRGVKAKLKSSGYVEIVP